MINLLLPIFRKESNTFLPGKSQQRYFHVQQKSKEMENPKTNGNNIFAFAFGKFPLCTTLLQLACPLNALQQSLHCHYSITTVPCRVLMLP